MKKLINEGDKAVDECVEGFLKLNKGTVKRVGDVNAIARREAPIEGKVGIVIGGGAGHEPLFLEFIGEGMADAVAHGDIFAAPSPKVALEATRAADGGEGVLYIYGNYEGDIMNFDMAAEMAESEGIKTETIRVRDDVASAGPENKEERRGISGDLFVIKIAGAKAKTCADLDEVKKTVEKARDNTRSIGIALTSATLPNTGEKTFEIGDDEMEVGMGVHGEPGVERTEIKKAEETTQIMVEKLIEDLPFKKNDEVLALVNSYGATTRLELHIVYNELSKILEKRKIDVYNAEVGAYCTTQEMAGCSITLMKLDEELKRLYNTDVNTPGYKFFKK
ncbi:dihydroxyacetone kinase [candidate division MSBL1 archaeon SCGC-AAA259E19]|uniref:Dihydroxyacetone kinase n=1 Tax=candidate division MSBL1 archaeon SCGC-AAA259E19 TaxID=1698264 RepID=A0A133ULS9_9EURY|nr:dihydroxyacetone kinase [candidate division MSBL1 archaeon SCGC-AAA259E19]